MANNKYVNQGTKNIITSKKKKKKKIYRTIRRTIFSLLLLTIVFLGVVFYERYGKEIIELKKEADFIVENSSASDFKASETSLIYDADGNLLTKVKSDKDVYYLSFDEIPQYFKDAIISIEDKKFYKHSGYDLKANARAVLAYVKNEGAITQGASTITQQLSKNVYLSNEKTWQRKVEEIFISVGLEKKYSKDEILEFYLNNIYFANGYYGIEAASKGYFSVDADQLTLSQIAFLCAIPNNPTTYNPLTNFDNTITRRNKILKSMLSDGKISELDYEIAMSEEINLNQTVEETVNNYIQSYVFDCATRALMEYNGFRFRYEFDTEEQRQSYLTRYDEMYTECQQMIYTGGYRIYTSIEMDKQELLQKSIDDTLSVNQEVSEDGIYALQGAATCVDNSTGRVVAIVGGRSQENVSNGSLNRAYQSYRQPGSSIKPLIVYTPCLERDYTPDSIVQDTAIKDGPKNADGTYSGSITLRTAVQYSKNTVAYKLLDELTPKVGCEYILNMEFDHITVEDTNNLSSALGGFTYGVTTSEMAAAYATIENDGNFRGITCINRIEDSDGNVIINMDAQDPVNIYKESACRLMTDVLETVITSGTGAGSGLPVMPCAGKTGTTNDDKDGWFCGYTPYYTTAVWIGYDTPKTISTIWSTTKPGTIWKNFMSPIHEDLPYKSFNKYVEKDNSEGTTEASTEDTTTESIEETTTEKETTTEVTTEEPTSDTEAPSTEASTEPTTSTSNEPTTSTGQGNSTDQ